MPARDGPSHSLPFERNRSADADADPQTMATGPGRGRVTDEGLRAFDTASGEVWQTVAVRHSLHEPAERLPCTGDIDAVHGGHPGGQLLGVDGDDVIGPGPRHADARDRGEVVGRRSEVSCVVGLEDDSQRSTAPEGRTQPDGVALVLLPELRRDTAAAGEPGPGAGHGDEEATGRRCG